MDVGSFLIADAQTAKLIQPGESSFHHPSKENATGIPQSMQRCGTAE